MAGNKTITIYPKKQDPDLKRMIRDLQKHDGANNKFRDRSESEIAKMILREGLEKIHKRMCGRK